MSLGSKLITLNGDGKTAEVKDAKIGDVFTSLINPNQAVTGVLGLAQRAGLFSAGMVTQEFRHTGSLNPFKKVERQLI